MGCAAIGISKRHNGVLHLIQLINRRVACSFLVVWQSVPVRKIPVLLDSTKTIGGMATIKLFGKLFKPRGLRELCV